MTRSAVAAHLLAAALLAGCGGGGGGAGPLPLPMAVWEPENPAAWDEAIRLFHETHPGIRIERQVAPNSSTQFHDLLAQQLRNGDESLDAFLMDVVWPPEFALAGWARPLDDLLPPEERQKFFPGAIEAVTVDGRLYGIPLNTDGGLLYYRKDLLDRYALEVPRTWSDLVATAATIVREEGDPSLHGYCGQFAQYEGLVCNMLEFVHSSGGDLMQPAGPAVVQAVTFVRDRIIEELCPRGVLTYQEQESLDLFRRGGAVFLRNWPYAWTILEADGSPVRHQVGLAPLPAFEGGTSAAALGGWSFGIHSKSRHPEEAAAFVRFMTGPAIQRHFAVAEGKAPARRALYDDPAVLAANPHFESLRAALEGAVPRPGTPIYPRVSHILQLALHRAIADPSSDVPALLSGAAKEIGAEMERLN